MNAVVTDPVTMVYHELRSPLSLMATAARSAAEDCDDDVLRARCLTIVQAAERMLRTAGHLMFVAEAARSDEWLFFDPSSVIDSVAANYRAMGAAVVVDRPESLGTVATGSAGTFEALICSLIGNAMDHATEDSPVSISVTPGDSACQFVVTNPIGKGRHRGLGLGSYIAGKLAEELSASIDTERRDDVFEATVTLPTWQRSLAAAS